MISQLSSQEVILWDDLGDTDQIVLQQILGRRLQTGDLPIQAVTLHGHRAGVDVHISGKASEFVPLGIMWWYRRRVK